MKDKNEVQPQVTQTIKNQKVINKSGTGGLGVAVWALLGAAVTAVANYFGYDVTSIISLMGL